MPRARRSAGREDGRGCFWRGQGRTERRERRRGSLGLVGGRLVNERDVLGPVGGLGGLLLGRHLGLSLGAGRVGRRQGEKVGHVDLLEGDLRVLPRDAALVRRVWAPERALRANSPPGAWLRTGTWLLLLVTVAGRVGGVAREVGRDRAHGHGAAHRSSRPLGHVVVRGCCSRSVRSRLPTAAGEDRETWAVSPLP